MDQFGGENNEKFNVPRWKEMLKEIHGKPMDKQKQIVEERMKKWMANTDQIDDILVIGVQV
ncbi:MAG: hypothetical protein HUJ25_03440 [Crocinitomicaceae bacterium]|nr:hypothetical protein [Crocinitomicaceae bacterium]